MQCRFLIKGRNKYKTNMMDKTHKKMSKEADEMKKDKMKKEMNRGEKMMKQMEALKKK